MWWRLSGSSEAVSLLVFLVLCTNVSSLLLARFNARRRDIALSSALGASRARLIWQASVENVLLGVMGAAVGVILAFWLVSTTSTVLPQAFVTRSLNPVNVDERALAVAVAARCCWQRSSPASCRPQVQGHWWITRAIGAHPHRHPIRGAPER